MKRMLKAAFCGICVIIISVCLFGCAPEFLELPENGNTIDLEGGDWNLVFGDEFEGNELDHTIWAYNEGVRRAAVNSSDKKHVFVNDGKLTIRTSFESTPYGDTWTTGYISTCTDTKDGYWTHKSDDFTGFSQTYGYFEISCIAPPTYGIWSAFWMMPDPPALGMDGKEELFTGENGIEIDVMESPHYYNKTEQNLNLHVLHGNNYDKTKTDKSPTYRVPNMYSEFHRYGVEWTEEEYIFYIDGKETWRSKHFYKDPKTGEEYNMGVSKVNEYILLTVEVAGEYDAKSKTFSTSPKNWCGQPSDNDKSKAYDFIIDYVRVYQRA